MGVMKTTTDKNQNVVTLDQAVLTRRALTTGMPALDGKLDGGLRVNQITEFVGPARLSHMLAQSCIAAAKRDGHSIALIDYVHDIGIAANQLNGLTVCQPDNLAVLPKLVGSLIGASVKLIVVFLGDSISFDHGIPRSAVDENLSRALQQLPWTVATGGSVCLVISDWPVIPNGTTVIRAFGINGETSELFLKVTSAIEGHRTAINS